MDFARCHKLERSTRSIRAGSKLCGTGGLGIYLRMNNQELEYENAMGVITLIIGLVIVSEVTPHYLRGRFYQD